MFAQKYTAYYGGNPQYKTALANDVFVPCRIRGRDLSGIADWMVRYIEDYQLFNEKKWEQFVAQFASGCVDSQNNGWRGEYWGKLMRGACITYGYTRNERLYAVLTKTVNDLLKTQDALGRFSTYAVETEYRGWDIWSRKYVILGLLHYHEICTDVQLKERIISALEAHLDYMVRTIGEGKVEINDTSNIWGAANSVSLLEPVMRMYNQTGKASYLDFAHYIVKTGPKDFNIFEEAYKNEKAPYQWPIQKAYELMSCFEGLLEYYRVTGVEKWKIAAINFAERVMETDVSVIGCCGCDLECFDHCAATQTNPTFSHLMQETCVTVTWMKLCYQLLRLTGDVKFAHEIERSVYNALYGAVNTEKTQVNGGLPFDSYSPLRLGNRGRCVGGQQFDAENKLIYGCCVAIGAAGTGLVPEIAASAGKNGVVFNLYIGGVYHLVTPQNDELTVKVKTNYPVDGRVDFEILPEKAEEFAIMLRVPAFSKKTTLTVNGQPAPVKEGYLTLNRCWQQGDTITLNIDMSPRVVHPIGCGVPGSLDFVAVKYGPLVLARDARLNKDVGQVVDLAYDENDAIALEATSGASFPTLCQFKVPCKDGSFVHMVDYQSAGKTLDDNSATEAWLPTAR